MLPLPCQVPTNMSSRLGAIPAPPAAALAAIPSSSNVQIERVMAGSLRDGRSEEALAQIRPRVPDVTANAKLLRCAVRCGEYRLRLRVRHASGEFGLHVAVGHQ